MQLLPMLLQHESSTGQLLQKLLRSCATTSSSRYDLTTLSLAVAQDPHLFAHSKQSLLLDSFLEPDLTTCMHNRTA